MNCDRRYPRTFPFSSASLWLLCGALSLIATSAGAIHPTNVASLSIRASRTGLDTPPKNNATMMMPLRPA